jgi:hypothetical protein
LVWCALMVVDFLVRSFLLPILWVNRILCQIERSTPSLTFCSCTCSDLLFIGYRNRHPRLGPGATIFVKIYCLTISNWKRNVGSYKYLDCSLSILSKCLLHNSLIAVYWSLCLRLWLGLGLLQLERVKAEFLWSMLHWEKLLNIFSRLCLLTFLRITGILNGFIAWPETCSL